MILFLSSVDAREGKISSAVHWSSMEREGRTFYFILSQALSEHQSFIKNKTKYSHHPPTGQNTIVINGQDTILTKHGSISSTINQILGVGRSSTDASVHSRHNGSGNRTSRRKKVDGLLIEELQREDEGDYHCRVDFHNSPTRNVRIRLHVIGKYLFTTLLCFLKTEYIF